jgi:hypothetical protein
MRPRWAVLLALLACGENEPDYPPFDGPAPTVSDFVVDGREASAILRDPQGAATIGRTEYTYVYFYQEGNNDSQVSFAPEWTWTRVDDLTWRVTVPNLVEDWSASAWHVADEDANVQSYSCPNGGDCVAYEEPVGPF